MGCTAAIVFTCFGASYGTAKAGVGIVAAGVLRPDLIVRSMFFCFFSSPAQRAVLLAFFGSGKDLAGLGVFFSYSPLEVVITDMGFLQTLFPSSWLVLLVFTDLSFRFWFPPVWDSSFRFTLVSFSSVLVFLLVSLVWLLVRRVSLLLRYAVSETNKLV